MLLLFAREFQKSIVLFANFINNCVPVDSLTLICLKQTWRYKELFLSHFAGVWGKYHLSLPLCTAHPLPKLSVFPPPRSLQLLFMEECLLNGVKHGFWVGEFELRANEETLTGRQVPWIQNLYKRLKYWLDYQLSSLGWQLQAGREKGDSSVSQEKLHVVAFQRVHQPDNGHWGQQDDVPSTGFEYV